MSGALVELTLAQPQHLGRTGRLVPKELFQLQRSNRLSWDEFVIKVERLYSPRRWRTLRKR